MLWLFNGLQGIANNKIKPSAFQVLVNLYIKGNGMSRQQNRLTRLTNFVCVLDVWYSARLCTKQWKKVINYLNQAWLRCRGNTSALWKTWNVCQFYMRTKEHKQTILAKTCCSAGTLVCCHIVSFIHCSWWAGAMIWNKDNKKDMFYQTSRWSSTQD